MKKLTFLFATILVSATMMAAEKKNENAFSSTTMQEGVSAYDKSWENVDGTTLVLTNFNNYNKGWSVVKCGRQKVASTATIATKAALTEKITKVEVVTQAASTVNENGFYLEVAPTADFTTTDEGYEKIILTIAGNTTNTFKITTPAADMFYRITFDCAANANGSVVVEKVNFVYEVEEVSATDITLNKTELSLEQYREETLTYELTPAEANTTVVWTSSNESVATVVDGLVTAIANTGSATITATAGEGITATCTVTVSEATVLTCAEAAEKASKVAANNTKYEGGQYVVEGYVNKVSSATAIWISDFYALTEGTIEIYKTASTDAAKEVKVGDYVRAVGYLTKYNKTNELAEGCIFEIIEAPKYNITLGEFTNGTVGADVEEARVGTEVTLTITPADGYKLDKLSVTAADDTEITVTDNKFEMPQQAVTVTATFAKDEETALDAVVSSSKAQKTIENGQVVIRVNGKQFNAAGQELK